MRCPTGCRSCASSRSGITSFTPASKRRLVLDWIKDARGLVPDARQPESSRIRFPEFLPESLLVRFAGHWFSRMGKPQDDLCRRQVVVGDPAYPQVRAIVQADLATRSVVIWTCGGMPDQQLNVDGKVRGVIQQLAKEEGLRLEETCWVHMAAKQIDDMEYLLYPPFFVIQQGETSFAEAWEVVCCEVLSLHEKTTQIYRHHAPEGGVDLLCHEKGIAYQCKSVESGRTGDFDVSKAVASIKAAWAHLRETRWKQYCLCTNAELTGPQEEKVRKELRNVKLLTPSFWVPLCRKYHEHVYRRFRVLAPMRGRAQCGPAAAGRAPSGPGSEPHL